MKRLDFIRLMAGVPYGDYVMLYDNAGKPLSGFQASTFANPTKIEEGGILAPGTYRGTVTLRKGQKAILLADGGKLPSTKENPRHGGARVMDGIYVHTGDSETNRGSLGCLTIRPRYSVVFFSNLEIGEDVEINLL